MNKIVKKLTAFAVVCTAAMSCTAGAFAESFSDMPNDWRTGALENAVANGLISGMGDGTIAPDANITRAQMAAIIVRALGATEKTDISMFADVSADKWYYDELAKAVYMQAFSGDGSNMNPEKNITFQECFTVLSRVFGLCYRIDDKAVDGVLAAYSDGAQVADWAKKYYASVVDGGYWTGGESKLLRPSEFITRGEFAVVMDNLVKKYITSDADAEELPNGNVLVRGSDVKLDGKKINGDLIIGDGVPANKISLNDVEITGNFVLRGCATPTMKEYKNSDGTTGEKLSYGDIGCAVTGSCTGVYIVAPYISADISGLKYSTGWAISDTNIFVNIMAGAEQSGTETESDGAQAE